MDGVFIGDEVGISDGDLLGVSETDCVGICIDESDTDLLGFCEKDFVAVSAEVDSGATAVSVRIGNSGVVPTLAKYVSPYDSSAIDWPIRAKPRTKARIITV